MGPSRNLFRVLFLTSLPTVSGCVLADNRFLHSKVSSCALEIIVSKPKLNPSHK